MAAAISPNTNQEFIAVRHNCRIFCGANDLKAFLVAILLLTTQ